jgi:hypothetical protein
MNSKRTAALLALLLLIVVACILLRATALTPSETTTNETSTANSPVMSEEVPEDIVVEPPTNTPSEPNPPAVITPAPTPQKSCYVGGCSSQVCSENPDVATTCEWRESYACYQTATCERQQSGECGWTQTPVLQACLMEANSNTSVSL